jgi:hypothetical protein
MNKIYAVIQESSDRFETIFNIVPCANLKKAQEVMQDEKKTLINESYGDDVTIEEDATSFYITDGNGKYDMISIEEKEVLK